MWPFVFLELDARNESLPWELHTGVIDQKRKKVKRRCHDRSRFGGEHCTWGQLSEAGSKLILKDDLYRRHFTTLKMNQARKHSYGKARMLKFILAAACNNVK